MRLSSSFRLINRLGAETGTFNFKTATVNHNARNFTVLRDVTVIAQSYMKERERHRADSDEKQEPSGSGQRILGLPNSAT